MVKNLKLYQKVLALVLAAGITASGIAAGMKLHKTNEVNRVKGYLEDFTTQDGYVDLSSISSTYKIKDFDGEYLRLAMEELDVDYVRITDSYIFNGDYENDFPIMLAFNYNNLLGYDNNGNPVYETYDPIRISTEDGVRYIYPEGFTLKEVVVSIDPVSYKELDDTEVHVSQDSEDSYTLTLNRK